jgi:hypothetical protein
VINIGFTQPNEDIISYKVSTVDGRDVSGQINTADTNQLDISQLESGIYFIEVETNKAVYKEKLVK